jgi:RNA polymerase sigma factor (sigma-70 family)
MITNDDVDLEIVLGIKKDQELFKILYKKYESPIRWYIYHKLSFDSRTRMEDSKDMAAITMEYLYKMVMKHDEVQSVKALVYTQANRLIWKYYLNRRQFYTIVDEVSDAIDNTVVIADQLSPEHIYIRDEFFENVHKIIYMMPEHYAIAADLYYLKGLEQEQIGKVLNVPQSTIEGRICYSKAFIAKRINGGKSVIKRNIPLSFTDEEISFCKNNFHSLSMPELHKEILKMHKTPIHIETLRKYCNENLKLKREHTGLTKKHVFSEDDNKLIASLHATTSNFKILEKLNEIRAIKLPIHALDHQIKRIGLKKR